jgi:predicted Rossmann fold nucleotide-binding protein DprA/Smf involved in DNA uptake
MRNSEIVYTIALSLLPNKLLKRVFSYINASSAYDIYHALRTEESFEVVKHISSVYSGSLLDVAEKILYECKQKRIKILNYYSEKYPELLRQIAGPPIVLYVRTYYPKNFQ